ncbi:hypothetical protein [Acinetobacter sp. NS-4]|uniref:hypothetical protein n=1 Tax=Acinetobacter sp. NS-4 TaxID=3127956 RepID=UPI00307D9BAE
MPDIQYTSDRSMIKILKNKYDIDYKDWGSDDVKDIAIFKNWMRLFDALCYLGNKAINGSVLNESDFQIASTIQNIFERLGEEHRGIFDYPYQIRFELFHVFKQCLELYDQQVIGFGHNKFLQSLSHHAEYGQKFPAGACVKFYSIFKQQLDLGGSGSNWISMNQQRLVASQSEIYELYKRYGSLSTINVIYQLRLTKDQRQQFHVFRLIEQQIASDTRLLKVLFKFEDDGQQGCFLNCILIYPSQALSNINKCIGQLELLAEMCINDIEIKFRNWGSELSRISGEDVVGLINNIGKLEIFLYWAVGSFYRHDDFFYYASPICELSDEEFRHEQVWKPWTLSLKPDKAGMLKNLTHISQAELMSYISDTEKVWSTKILSVQLQKELEIDRIFLSELPYELEQLKTLNREILGCLQVFQTFLNIGSEPFFFVEKLNDLITSVEPSKLGCQLIYLFNLLCQQPELRYHIKELDGWLWQRFQKVLNSKLWSELERLSLNGSQAITDVQTLQHLNTLRDLHPDPLSARSPGFDISNENHAITNFDESFACKRRTRDAQEYLGGLLKHDQLICRFKFYAEVGNVSILKERETFSVNFTEFLRVHKRSGLLKDLNGYFLIWSNKFIHNQFEKQKVDPYVDIVLLVEPSYGFCFSSFEQNLILAWEKFKGKNALSSEHIRYFRSSGLVSVNLMNSEELLTSTLVHFEKRNTRLKKVLLEKLVPYFTYRHFYLPKFYDVKKNKKIKMFSKGSSTSKTSSK